MVLFAYASHPGSCAGVTSGSQATPRTCATVFKLYAIWLKPGKETLGNTPLLLPADAKYAAASAPAPALALRPRCRLYCTCCTAL